MKSKLISIMRVEWPCLVLALFVVVFFGDCFFAHQAPVLRDIFCQMPYWPQFAAHSMRTGEWIPFWNPFAGYGKPYVADPETGFFYPLNWIFYLFSPATGLTFFCAAHLFIAGISAYALGRHWRLDPGPALFAAVSFAFSTWLIGMMEFRAPFAVCAYGPLDLLLAGLLLKKIHGHPLTLRLLGSAWGLIALLAFLLALQYLAGNLERLFYLLFLVAGYIAMQLLLQLKSWRTALGIALALAIAGLLAFCLVMPQFLISSEFIARSERTSTIDPGLAQASWGPGLWPTLLLPFLYGRPGYAPDYWAPQIFEFWAGTCYVGVAALIGATLAPFCLSRSSSASGEMRVLFWFLVGTALFALVMAAGNYTPIYMLFHHAVPLFDRFRWPSKFLLFLLYSLSYLGAIGWQVLLNRSSARTPSRNLVIVWISWVAFLGLLRLGYGMAQGSPGFYGWLTHGAFVMTDTHRLQENGDYGACLIFTALSLLLLGLFLFRRVGRRTFLALLVTLAFINLAYIGRQVLYFADKSIYDLHSSTAALVPAEHRYDMIFNLYAGRGQFLYGSRSVGDYAWARDIAVNDTLQADGLSEIYQDGLKLESNLELQFLLAHLSPEQTNRLADISNIRYLLTGKPGPGQAANHPAPALVERTSALPHAFLVPRWRIVDDPALERSILVSPEFNPDLEALIEPVPGQPRIDPPAEEFADEKPVGIVRREWNQVVLDATAPTLSLLVLDEAWYPGWTASVDGTAVPVYKANRFFRAVLVPPGSHRIVFHYYPRHFSLGCLVSLLALLGLALGTVFSRRMA